MYPHPIPVPFGLGNPQDRLSVFRQWIAAGWALDLNDAVRVNALLLRNAQQEELNRAPYYWGQRIVVKQQRRWEHHRRLVLSKATSCSFCTRPPSEITYAKALSEGGTDRLRNKIPVCDTCCNLWPQMRRALPHRVREKLAVELICMWGRHVRCS